MNSKRPASNGGGHWKRSPANQLGIADTFGCVARGRDDAVFDDKLRGRNAETRGRHREERFTRRRTGQRQIRVVEIRWMRLRA